MCTNIPICRSLKICSRTVLQILLLPKSTQFWKLTYNIHNSWYFSPLFTNSQSMAPHSSTLAWKIPWAEEPGRLKSMGSLRVAYDWVTSLSTFMHWRRKWQPTPVFLPGESQGRLPSMGSHSVRHDWSDLAADLAVAVSTKHGVFLQWVCKHA